VVKIGEFLWFPVPPLFTGTVGYSTESSDQAEDVTVQISAPRIELLPETSSYSVTFAPEGGLLSGSFVPTCQPVGPTQIGGVLTGFASSLSITIRLAWGGTG